MNIKLGNKIAEGGCSNIYEWGEQQLVKVAKPNTHVDAMRREFENNQLAWQAGLPVANAYEFLEVNERPAIIYERINGETLMERFTKRALDVDNSNMGLMRCDFQILARLLSDIHQTEITYAPSEQKNYLKHCIQSVNYLTESEKQAVIAKLEALPSKGLLCHGDPNPGNVIVKADGSAVVIDWMDATIGNPAADLAEFIVMIRYAILPPVFPSEFTSFFDSIREAIIEIVMDEYTRLTGVTLDEIEPWLVPIAARKLCADAISDEEKQLLIQEIRRKL